MSETTPKPDEPTDPTEPTEPEADEPEADEPTEPEAAPPPPPVSEVDMEKAIRALNKENDRHEKRVAEIMGADFATMRVCPLDDGMGFIGPDVSVVEAYRFSPETGSLAPVVTDARPDELYQENPQTQRCETCDGRGQVKTGARPEAAAIGQCPTCGGQGWTLRTNVTQLPAPSANAAVGGVGYTVAPSAPALPVPADPAVAAAAETLRAAGWTAFEPYREAPASP